MVRVTPDPIPGSPVNQVVAGGGNFFAPAGVPRQPVGPQLIDVAPLSRALQARLQQDVAADNEYLEGVGAEVARRLQRGEEADSIIKDITSSKQSSNRVRAMLQRAVESGKLEQWESPAFQQGFQRVRAEQKGVLLDSFLKERAGEAAAELAEVTDVTKRSAKMAEILRRVQGEAEEQLGAHDLGFFGNEVWASRSNDVLSGFASDVDSRARRIQETEFVRNTAAPLEGKVQSYIQASRQGFAPPEMLVDLSSSLAIFHKELQRSSVADKEGKAFELANSVINQTLIESPAAAEAVAMQLLNHTRIDGHLIWTPEYQARLGAKVVDVQRRAETQQREADLVDQRKRRDDFAYMDQSKAGSQLLAAAMAGDIETVRTVAANVAELAADGELSPADMEALFGETFESEQVNSANVVAWADEAAARAFTNAQRLRKAPSPRIIADIERLAFEGNREEALDMLNANLEVLLEDGVKYASLRGTIEQLASESTNAVSRQAKAATEGARNELVRLLSTRPGDEQANWLQALSYGFEVDRRFNELMSRSTQNQRLQPDTDEVNLAAQAAMEQVLREYKYEALKENGGLDPTAVDRQGLDAALKGLSTKQEKLEDTAEPAADDRGLVFGLFPRGQTRSIIKDTFDKASRGTAVKHQSIGTMLQDIRRQSENTDYTPEQVDLMLSQTLVMQGRVPLKFMLQSEEFGELDTETLLQAVKYEVDNIFINRSVQKMGGLDLGTLRLEQMHFPEFKNAGDYVSNGKLVEVPPGLMRQAVRLLENYGYPTGDQEIIDLFQRHKEFYK